MSEEKNNLREEKESETKETSPKENISTEEKKEENQEEQIIFDINLKSIDDLVDILIKNEYDFLVIEPLENSVRVSFKKDSILKLQKYIRYGTYSSLLISIKKISNLDLEKNDIEQK
jgi:type II secretory ATPase GspE/PulE/Tfp pilus assembly ATPase PilB-like protein